MKKIHFILVSSTIFLLLFYKEAPGMNVGIFGLVLTGLICFYFQDRFTDRSHLVLVITSVLSCISFAWYGDPSSFMSMFLSVVFLQFKTQENKLKIIQVFPLVFLNGITSLGRILMFSQWVPQQRVGSNLTKKLIAYVMIPAIFLFLFFIVYSFGSNHFSSLFTDYTLDIDILQLVLISVLGFYISFTFWNYWVPDFCYENNAVLDNDFENVTEIKNQNTFSFLDLDFERKSGEITLLLLNCMLLVFIATYNYEQFFETSNAPVAMSKLSAATHERVNSVIFSILMAIGVIMFYFKGGFNFDEKAAKLKKLSKLWIVLNGVLIVSTFIKNTEYISFFGLTYKRLGVYAFLTLAIIGLVYTFLKITRQKTNAYLFNQMIWYFYGTLLICGFVNWGNLITTYNISVNKGLDPGFLSSLNFNDETRRAYFKQNNLETLSVDIAREAEIKRYQNETFLSKTLYYECINNRE